MYRPSRFLSYLSLSFSHLALYSSEYHLFYFTTFSLRFLSPNTSFHFHYVHPFNPFFPHSVFSHFQSHYISSYLTLFLNIKSRMHLKYFPLRAYINFPHYYSQNHNSFTYCLTYFYEHCFSGLMHFIKLLNSVIRKASSPNSKCYTSHSAPFSSFKHLNF